MSHEINVIEFDWWENLYHSLVISPPELIPNKPITLYKRMLFTYIYLYLPIPMLLTYSWFTVHVWLKYKPHESIAELEKSSKCPHVDIPRVLKCPQECVINDKKSCDKSAWS